MQRIITIRFSTNRRGKRVAHYWGTARRWLPIGLEAARVAVATGALWGSTVVEHDGAQYPSTRTAEAG
jgi:hypothetical protein